jgi:hypothetical protein
VALNFALFVVCLHYPSFAFNVFTVLPSLFMSSLSLRFFTSAWCRTYSVAAKIIGRWLSNLAHTVFHHHKRGILTFPATPHVLVRCAWHTSGPPRGCH